MWYKHLNRHWNRTKSFIHQGYKQLHGWAGEVERAAGIGKRIFSTIAPILEDLGQRQAVEGGMKAIQGYDSLRQNVQDIDANVRRHASRVGNADLFY